MHSAIPEITYPEDGKSIDPIHVTLALHKLRDIFEYLSHTYDGVIKKEGPNKHSSWKGVWTHIFEAKKALGDGPYMSFLFIEVLKRGIKDLHQLVPTEDTTTFVLSCQEEDSWFMEWALSILVGLTYVRDRLTRNDFIEVFAEKVIGPTIKVTSGKCGRGILDNLAILRFPEDIESRMEFAEKYS
ncbi:MAG: hypothetical protein MRY49_03370 [Candidatus Pacebacteria bacterium]|nr:hypothetical protein [Candidatus Paceibacterota bacterium]